MTSPGVYGSEYRITRSMNKATRQDKFILAAQKRGWHIYGDGLSDQFIFYETGDGAFYVTGEFVKWKPGYQWDDEVEGVIMRAYLNGPDKKKVADAYKDKVKRDMTGMFKRGELTKNEVEFILLRYGLLRTRPVTLAKIANDFKLTRERVRQIVASGTLKVWNKYRYWLK